MRVVRIDACAIDPGRADLRVVHHRQRHGTVKLPRIRKIVRISRHGGAAIDKISRKGISIVAFIITLPHAHIKRPARLPEMDIPTMRIPSCVFVPNRERPAFKKPSGDRTFALSAQLAVGFHQSDVAAALANNAKLSITLIFMRCKTDIFNNRPEVFREVNPSAPINRAELVKWKLAMKADGRVREERRREFNRAGSLVRLDAANEVERDEVPARGVVRTALKRDSAAQVDLVRHDDRARALEGNIGRICRSREPERGTGVGEDYLGELADLREVRIRDLIGCVGRDRVRPAGRRPLDGRRPERNGDRRDESQDKTTRAHSQNHTAKATLWSSAFFRTRRPSKRRTGIGSKSRVKSCTHTAGSHPGPTPSTFTTISVAPER